MVNINNVLFMMITIADLVKIEEGLEPLLVILVRVQLEMESKLLRFMVPLCVEDTILMIKQNRK